MSLKQEKKGKGKKKKDVDTSRAVQNNIHNSLTTSVAKSSGAHSGQRHFSSAQFIPVEKHSALFSLHVSVSQRYRHILG